jgi:hypothetical protein
VERSDWSDDDALEPGAYPPAPLPPHERSWRHPSELGTANWSHLDPPLTIGRGLLIATGAIGGLLSIAVLWAMLPSAGRGSLASPTAVTSTANDLAALVSSPRADTLVASTLARSGSTVLTSVPRATTSVPARSTPSSVVTSTLDPRDRTQDDDDLPPVAVAVGDTMVITTARAAQGHTFVTVTGSDGQPHDVTVLMVDRDLGVAVLSPEAAAMTASYAIAPAAADGDAVTVLTSAPISTNVHVDAKGRLTIDAWDKSIAEGTPVVNANGLLVGMCSHGASGPMLVNVANLASLLDTKPQPAGAWLGIHIVDSAAGPDIDGIDPTGPAGQAGMVVGDVITAVDGASVATIDDLKNAVAAHASGDTVVVTVLHADQSSTDLTVTLGTAPSI